jgi:hypothetical protein
LRGQCGMLVLVRAGMLGWARPLSIPFGGHDREEVIRFSSAVRLRQEEGVMADPDLSVRLGSLGLAGPQSFRHFTSWCVAGCVTR